MLIRQMVKEDLPTVLALEKLLYKDPWNENNFASELEGNDYSYIFVLEENGNVLGYVGFWISYEYVTITKVSINPLLQGRGLGYYLFNSVLDIARNMGGLSFSLEVRKSNFKAIGLYEKSGFVNQGVRKKYYSDQEDALVFILEEGDVHYESSYNGNRE